MSVRRSPTKYERLPGSDLTDERRDQYELQDYRNILSSQDAGPGRITHIVDESRSSKHKSRFQTSGWRVGAIAAATTTICVLILNVSVTVWISSNRKFDNDGNGWKVMFRGSCSTTKNTSRWIHLIINGLATLLLGASNYFMQVICSPTRWELNKAHKKHVWLHIGVPNIRNLRHISHKRSFLWVMLFISSIPLHLAFNSVIFADVQANDYRVMPVTDDFLSGGKYNTSGFIAISTSHSETIVKAAEELRAKFQNLISASNTTNLSSADCMNAYNNQYVSRYGDVLLIQQDIVWRSPYNYTMVWRNPSQWTWKPLNSSTPCTSKNCTNMADELPFKADADTFPSNGWRCPSRSISNCTLTLQGELSNVAPWEPYGSPISHCVVELVDEQCKLQFSPSIAAAVIMCNSIKAICMLIIIFKCQDSFLVTLGDAISSFLEQPDPDTKGHCLCGKPYFRLKRGWNKEINPSSGLYFVQENREDTHTYKKIFWGRAASRLRWCMTYLMYCAAMAFAGFSIKRSLVGMPTDISQLWDTGFGELKGNNLLQIGTSTIGSILLANTPQAILSYLYVCYNALFTCMFVQHEVAQYSKIRKPLRVTSPVSQQRSTFWLQIPYRYAMPLIALSVLLHWMASQSFFVVSITIINKDKEPDAARKLSTCGYSPVAIILTTCIGCIIALGGLVLAVRRFPPGMPLISSCSAAISAACHPPEDDQHCAQLPVKWGVVQESNSVFKVGHITFAGIPVTEPLDGKTYA